ncbi:MAG: tRNA 2-thiouridine(34) synthase MnmA [Verrucomicrobia bacterium]|nr:tRNA 2-thiouridine(34) synthase MnmA [Verrucomicrobiota bacterium]
MTENRTEGAGRIAVGMSGGLDSSAVASLLAEQGREVVGLTLHMWKEGSRCCSIEDVERAKYVCEALGIRHFVINAEELFDKTIVEPFIEQYVEGLTPSPCIKCNQYIKFGPLLERAMDLGCTRLATGHYVRTEQKEDGWHLYQAKDKSKDQSYFLHRLSQEQLSKSVFPLGTWTKDEIKAYAVEKALPVSFRSESQDLCFITGAGHAEFLERMRPGLSQEGPIVDEQGNELGKHTGYYRYTIGQRKGLGVASSEPLYVKNTDADTNTVTLGARATVMDQQMKVHKVLWMHGPSHSTFDCRVRIRYRHEGAQATVNVTGDNAVEVIFKEPQFAITPGQAAVFYDGEEVLGGGWIGREC